MEFLEKLGLQTARLLATGGAVQGAHVTGGLCWGLSALWLSRSKQSRFWSRVDKTFIDGLEAWDQGGGELAKAAQIYVGQQPFRPAANNAFLAETAGIVADTSSSSVEGRRGSFSQMTSWMARQRGQYFMVTSTGLKHEMAVAYDSHGLRFFDPNSGIVSCRNSASLASFFDAYLADNPTSQYRSFRAYKYT